MRILTHPAGPDYLLIFTIKVQEPICSVRADAEEAISYRMPPFLQNGVAKLEQALSNHAGEKGKELFKDSGTGTEVANRVERALSETLRAIALP